MQPIIHKTYGEQSTVWLSQHFLAEKAGVNETYFRTHVRPYYKKNSGTWRWTRFGEGFYYDYERLPDKYKPLLGGKTELIGLAHENMPQAEIIKVAKTKIMNAFLGYDKETAEACGWYAANGYADRAAELAQAWTWAMLVSDYTNKNSRLWIRLGLDKIIDVYTCAVEMLKEKPLTGFKVSSVSALYNKLKGFDSLSKEARYKLFIHKNEGNDHRVVLSDDCKLAIRVLRGMPQNFSDDFIGRKIQTLCTMYDWRMPSDRTIENYMTSKEVQTITELSRFGKSTRWHRLTNGTIRVAPPLFAGDCWQMDATRANMVAHLTKDANGKPVERHILPLMPEHKIYVEPFFGGGAVFWAKDPVKCEVVNDVNMNIVNFYEVLKHSYFDLRKLIEATLHSRETYKKAMIIYDCPWLFPDQPVQRAWAFWVVTNQGFSCKIGTWGYDRNKRAITIQNKVDQFKEEISDRLKYTQIECNEAHKVIASRDSDETFAYVDPPYIDSDQGHYGGYTEVHYRRDLEALAKMKGKFMLSSYPSKILDEFITKHGWHTKHIEMTLGAGNGAVMTKRKTKTEVLTMNYELKVEAAYN